MRSSCRPRCSGWPAVEYALLVILYMWRLAVFRAKVRADLSHPPRGFGFFTFVAGKEVLGTRLAPTDIICRRSCG